MATTSFARRFRDSRVKTPTFAPQSRTMSPARTPRRPCIDSGFLLHDLIDQCRRVPRGYAKCAYGSAHHPGVSVGLQSPAGCRGAFDAEDMYSLDTDARHACAMEQRRSRWRSASGKRNARFTKTVMWKAVRHAVSERPAARKGIHRHAGYTQRQRRPRSDQACSSIAAFHWLSGASGANRSKVFTNSLVERSI